MLKMAARAVLAHEELVESVCILVERPGNLELVPHIFVRDLLEEINWADEIAADRPEEGDVMEALGAAKESVSPATDPDSRSTPPAPP